jgi:hypothetical protein
MKKKILFFAPFRDTLQHSIPEAATIIALKDFYDIHVISCDNFLQENCMSMNAIGISDKNKFQKQNMCINCVKKSQTIDKEVNVKSSYLPKNYPGRVESKNKVLNKEELSFDFNYRYKKIPLGRFALFDLSVQEKSKFDLRDSQNIEKFNSKIINLQQLVDYVSIEINNIKPEILIVYNSLYAANRTVVQIAINQGIRTYSLHAGVMRRQQYSTLTMYSSNTDMMMVHNFPTWDKFLNQKIKYKDLEVIREYLYDLVGARNILTYSNKFKNLNRREILSKLNIRQAKRIVLITLSSEDEAYANEVTGLTESRAGKQVLFESQSEWLDYLINLFKNKDDYIVIIRLHPREFELYGKNKVNDHARNLIKKLNNLPSNFKINLPKDSISIFDILKVVDVTLTYTSSSAVDSAIFGVPVICQDKKYIYSFPHEICFMVNSKEEILDKIENVKHYSDEDIFEKFIICCKWILFYGKYNSIDIYKEKMDNDRKYTNRYQKTKYINIFFKKLLRIMPIKIKIYLYLISSRVSVQKRIRKKLGIIDKGEFVNFYKLIESGNDIISQVKGDVEGEYSDSKELRKIYQEIMSI